MFVFLAQAADQAGDAAKDVADKATAAAEQGAAGAAQQAGDAAAQATAAAEQVAQNAEPSFIVEMFDTGAMKLLMDGGFFMWPILLLGIVAAGVIIERYRSLKMLGTDSDSLRDNVRDLLEDNNAEAALKLCDESRGPVPAILSAGLRRFVVLRRLNYDPARIESGVVKSMEDYGVHVVAALERHLPVLATVASVAPMIGFLGTVQGMIVAFTDIEEGIGTANIVELAAGGIKVALLTTCFGLIVGIPAYLAYNYYTSVINRFVLDVEESAADLIETVTLHLTLAQHEGDADSSVPAQADDTEADLASA